MKFSLEKAVSGGGAANKPETKRPPEAPSDTGRRSKALKAFGPQVYPEHNHTSISLHANMRS